MFRQLAYTMLRGGDCFNHWLVGSFDFYDDSNWQVVNLKELESFYLFIVI